MVRLISPSAVECRPGIVSGRRVFNLVRLFVLFFLLLLPLTANKVVCVSSFATS